MANEPKEMTLDTIGNGELAEMVRFELRKIGENIADPNVKTDAKRRLTITIDIVPDAKGQTVQMDFNASSTLVKPSGSKTMAHIAAVPGSSAISFFEVEQHPNLFKQAPLPNVAELDPAKRA